MRLSFEQLRAAAIGIEKMEQTPQGVAFHRMTAEEESVYHARHRVFGDLADAGLL